MKYALYFFYALALFVATQFADQASADDLSNFESELAQMDVAYNDHSPTNSYRFVEGAKESHAVFPKEVLDEEMVGEGSRWEKRETKAFESEVKPSISDRREYQNSDAYLPEFRVKMRSISMKRNQNTTKN